MVAHVLTIWAVEPGRFNGRVGNTVLAKATATPFRDSARALLNQGLASLDDTITMHLGEHEVLRSTIAKAAAANAEPDL
jgi:hypothetical protein